MDLTCEFRRLTGLTSIGAVASPTPMPGSAFMLEAASMSSKLGQLHRDLLNDPEQMAAIHSYQDDMSRLERIAEDCSDLGLLAPVPPRNRDILASRKGVVSCLYEELKSLASKVQNSQVAEMQREADASNFFSSPAGTSSTAAAAAAAKRLKPPPLSEAARPLLPEARSEGEAAERLREEEQRLLTAFESDLDRIQETQTKVEELAAIIGLFATKVVEQQEVIDNNLELAEESTAYVEKAEEHLRRAVTNSNSYRFYVVCWFVGSALALLLFDFADARWSYI